MSIRITEEAGGASIAIKVVPGSSRDRVVGVLGDALKIAVSAPPTGGEANRAVIELLAEKLGLPISSVRILQGHGNPRKKVLIAGIRAEDLPGRLGLHNVRR